MDDKTIKKEAKEPSGKTTDTRNIADIVAAQTTSLGEVWGAISEYITARPVRRYAADLQAVIAAKKNSASDSTADIRIGNSVHIYDIATASGAYIIAVDCKKGETKEIDVLGVYKKNRRTGFEKRSKKVITAIVQAMQEQGRWREDAEGIQSREYANNLTSITTMDAFNYATEKGIRVHPREFTVFFEYRRAQYYEKAMKDAGASIFCPEGM